MDVDAINSLASCKGKGPSSPLGGCFKCGGAHFQRDCNVHETPTHRLFPEALRKSKAFEAVWYPLASMEEKVEVPEGREAWCDHRLHTERDLMSKTR